MHAAGDLCNADSPDRPCPLSPRRNELPAHEAPPTRPRGPLPTWDPSLERPMKTIVARVGPKAVRGWMEDGVGPQIDCVFDRLSRLSPLPSTSGIVAITLHGAADTPAQAWAEHPLRHNLHEALRFALDRWFAQAPGARWERLSIHHAE